MPGTSSVQRDAFAQERELKAANRERRRQRVIKLHLAGSTLNEIVERGFSRTYARKVIEAEGGAPRIEASRVRSRK